MEAIAVCLGLVPFIAGRTTLAVGLVALWYLQGSVRAEGRLTLASALSALPVAVVIVAVGYAADLAHRQLGHIFESTPETRRRGDQVLTLLAAVVVTNLVLPETESTTAAAFAAPPAFLAAGFGDRAPVFLAVGVLAVVFSTLRSRISEAFDLIPLSSEGGLSRALFWAEAAWTVVGLAIAIAFPVLGVVMAVGMLLTLLTLLWLVRRLSRGSRGPCPACGKSVNLAASVCPGCSGALEPRALGAFGRVLPGGPTDPQRHKLALLSGQCCPRCAERLTSKDGTVTCGACGQTPFRDPAEARAFVRHVDARVAAMTPIYAALGLVPILGLAVSLVLYRLSPAGALSNYVSWHQRLAPRLLRGLAVMGLGLVQPVPVLGAGATVAVIGATQVWTRKAFLASEAP